MIVSLKIGKFLKSSGYSDYSELEYLEDTGEVMGYIMCEYYGIDKSARIPAPEVYRALNWLIERKQIKILIDTISKMDEGKSVCKILLPNNKICTVSSKNTEKAVIKCIECYIDAKNKKKGGKTPFLFL